MFWPMTSEEMMCTSFCVHPAHKTTYVCSSLLFIFMPTRCQYLDDLDLTEDDRAPITLGSWITAKENTPKTTINYLYE